MIPKNVNYYCCEDPSLIENYDKAINDNSQIWECHHRFEIDKNLSRHQLIEQNLYLNRPACELIFLTKSDHTTLHNTYRTGEKHPLYGKHQSEETRRKRSESMKGKTPWIKGKHWSEESNRKRSEANKGLIPWNKGIRIKNLKND